MWSDGWIVKDLSYGKGIEGSNLFFDILWMRLKLGHLHGKEKNTLGMRVGVGLITYWQSCLDFFYDFSLAFNHIRINKNSLLQFYKIKIKLKIQTL
jgi:hypothetical protein